MVSLGVKPRILFVSGREAGYIRNRVLISALRRNFDVRVLTSATGGIGIRSARGLARCVADREGYDLCVVGFYGQLLAVGLSALQRKPLLFDAYVSTYDTLCEDRGRFRPGSLPGRLAFWLDRRSCQAAQRVLTDTRSDAAYFQRTFGLPASKFDTVYVGCDESLFYPRPTPLAEHPACEVFYYGSFLPLHGTDVILQAAALLRRRPDIHYTIGGDGMGFAAARRSAADLGLANVTFAGWIPIERLPNYIAGAAICLGGHFSAVPKAARVVSTKTFQFIAMGRPTIVGDNGATRELFRPGEHVLAVPMGDPAVLAQVIEHLADDLALRERIAVAGLTLYRERLSEDVIAAQLAAIVDRMACASVL
jgi:glycosyltransferase involved in cell wall biosynthesis